jgi:hypothetical protein
MVILLWHFCAELVNLDEALSCLTNIRCVIKIHNSHAHVHSHGWTSECSGVWMDELLNVRMEVFGYVCVCVLMKNG